MQAHSGGVNLLRCATSLGSGTRGRSGPDDAALGHGIWASGPDGWIMSIFIWTLPRKGGSHWGNLTKLRELSSKCWNKHAWGWKLPTSLVRAVLDRSGLDLHVRVLFSPLMAAHDNLSHVAVEGSHSAINGQVVLAPAVTLAVDEAVAKLGQVCIALAAQQYIHHAQQIPMSKLRKRGVPLGRHFVFRIFAFSRSVVVLHAPVGASVYSLLAYLAMPAFSACDDGQHVPYLRFDDVLDRDYFGPAFSHHTICCGQMARTVAGQRNENHHLL